MNILADLRSRCVTALASVTDRPDEFVGMVRLSQDARFGDYQANFAMPLGKQLGRNPREIATEVVEKIAVADLCEPPEIAGPGFINFRLKDDWLTARVNELVHDNRFGVPATDNPKSIVIDFSAPNVAKPMHVGHLRSTVIGDALCRIFRFLGHKVISDNHIGDWGTQFGMIIFGYKNFLDQEAFDRDMVGELARQYRLVGQLSGYHETRQQLPKLDAKLAEQMAALEEFSSKADLKDAKQKKQLGKLRDEVNQLRADIASGRSKLAAVEASPTLKAQADQFPEIATLARLETAKLHSGDEENLALWNRFVPACLDAIQGIYDRLEISFDHTLGESFYQPMLGEIVEDLLSRGLARESDGAICVFLPDSTVPFIIRKSDGAFTYGTTDLATIKYRVEHFHADMVLYVVDFRQYQDHFRPLYEVAKIWGYDQTEYRHVSFGTILAEDRTPFKTRSGDTVGLESLLDQAVTEAAQVTANDDSDELRPKLDAAAQQHVAEVVGLGGIKYADLKHNRESDYVFNWEKMLAKTGDTATYIQYAYARVCGIFRKGDIKRDELRSAGYSIVLTAPAERALAFHLSRFGECLNEVTVDCRPNLLAEYVYQLATTFTTFFDQCPVLKADSDDLRNSRLLLCDLTARFLNQGLSLLGIQTIDQM